MSPVFSPLHYPNIRQVNDFEELLGTPFENGVNALCWPRVLEGNFSQVASALGQANAGIIPIDEDELWALNLGVDGRLAVEAMLTDLTRLRVLGLQPEINCIEAYPRDDASVPTDVYSFHVDQAPIETDTWLCTYHGTPSEGLRNEHAHKCVERNALRASLLREFGGEESMAFETYLRERSYHLHYVPTMDASPWSFGVGHLWRIAVAWPGCPVPPCIHRAPADISGQRRLLLIS